MAQIMVDFGNCSVCHSEQCASCSPCLEGFINVRSDWWMVLPTFSISWLIFGILLLSITEKYEVSNHNYGLVYFSFQFCLFLLPV